MSSFLRTCRDCGCLGLINYDFWMHWYGDKGKYYPERKCIPCKKIRERETRDPNRRHSNYIARTHGITGQDYAALLSQQGGKCAICGRPQQDIDRRLRVDHDHETGRLRGLLCDLCNKGLGQFKDSPEVLRAAAEYLESRRM